MTETITEFAPAAERWGITDLLTAADLGGFAYEPPVVSGASDAVITQNGRSYVNFASCSLLGMHVDATAVEVFARAASRYGLATGGSRLIQGRIQPHVELEQALAAATGKERAMSFASGMLANVGFVHAINSSAKIARELLGISMPETVFVLDRHSHWSIRKAVEALPYKERMFYFDHNSARSLREVLAGLGGKQAIVMFESIYSSDGSMAPVGDIVDVAEEFGALTFIDDANGFFVYGGPGRPFEAEFDAIRRCTFHMVSFSKAIGLEGGGIAGPAEFLAAFEYLSGTSAFTATMLPPAAAAAVHIMDRLTERPDIVDTYLARTGRFRRALLDRGCTLSDAHSYITSVQIGPDDVAEAVRKDFLDAGYLVPVFRYPAVKVGEAGLRLMLNANHTDENIEAFLDTMTTIRARHRF